MFHELRAAVFVACDGANAILPLGQVPEGNQQIKPLRHEGLTVNSLRQTAQKPVDGQRQFSVPNPAETRYRQVPADVHGLQPARFRVTDFIFT